MTNPPKRKYFADGGFTLHSALAIQSYSLSTEAPSISGHEDDSGKVTLTF